MPDAIDSYTDGGGTSEPVRSSRDGDRLTAGEAKRIKERMNCAGTFYKTAFEDTYRRCTELYNGDHWTGKDSRHRKRDSKFVVINVIRHVVDTIVAATAHQNPKVTLQPQNKTGMENEDKSTRATNYYYRHTKAHRETKRVLQDSVTYGFGVAMTGWEQQKEYEAPVEGRRPVEGDEADPETITKMIEEGQELKAPAPKATIIKDEPFCRRLDPRCFRVSPECDWVLDGHAWCGYVEVVEIDDVKRDPRYNSSAVKKLKGNTISMKGYLSSEYRGLDDEKIPSDAKRVELWHYYEKRRRLHIVLCAEHDTPLLVEHWYWKHERYPFRLLFAPMLQSEFYAKRPLLVQLEPMQREINLCRSQLATHRARYNRKYATAKGTLSEDAKKALESGQDGVVVELEVAPGQVQGSVVPIQDAPIHGEVYQSDQIAQKDLSLLSSLDQYSMGNAPSKRLTTSEVSAIQSSGGPRQQDTRQRYEELCAGVAEDFLDLLQQWAQVTRDLPIYDDNERVVDWEPWTREEIQGDYQFEVFVGSTEIPNREGKLKDLGYLLQTLAPFAQAGQVNIIPLLEQMLRNVPGIHNVDEILQPQQQPGMEDMLQQQQLGGDMPPEMQQQQGAGGEQQIPPELMDQMMQQQQMGG